MVNLEEELLQITLKAFNKTYSFGGKHAFIFEKIDLIVFLSHIEQP